MTQEKFRWIKEAFCSPYSPSSPPYSYLSNTSLSKVFRCLRNLLPHPKKNFKTLQKITKTSSSSSSSSSSSLFNTSVSNIFQQRTWLFNRLGSAPKTKLQNTSKWQRNTSFFSSSSFFFPFKLFSFKRFSNRELRCLRDLLPHQKENSKHCQNSFLTQTSKHWCSTPPTSSSSTTSGLNLKQTTLSEH